MTFLLVSGRLHCLCFLALAVLFFAAPCVTAAQWPYDPRTGTSMKGAVPASFDCASRKAAYAYGKKLQSRQGKFESLYYALDLNGEDCKGEEEEEEDGDVISAEKERRQLKQEEEEKHHLPVNAVYVSLQGEDPEEFSTATTPTIGTPFRSIQVALDFAASSSQCHDCSHVIVREGVYYLEDTLLLTPSHSNLTLMAYPGEEVVLSGGHELQIDEWHPYKVGNNTNIWVTTLPTQPKEFPGLQINGKRATRARYPNIPGGLEVSCMYGCMIKSDTVHWTPPDLGKYGDPTFYTDNITEHTRNNNGWFEHYTIGVNGLCSVYDPPVSYWCSEHPSGGGAEAFETPSGLQPVDDTILPNAPYANTDDAVVFVWRPARWANWMFAIGDYNATTNNITFGEGGNQGARGNHNGGDWFIENVLEELDSPGEYYYDKTTKKLYLYYNGTGSPPLDDTYVIPQLRTLISFTGTQWNPVMNVSLTGFVFRATRYTYMDPHGVPSGGDWALERSAAVFLQGTENTTLKSCVFDRLDSNGLMISGYNRYATVLESDFSYIGGTAIASWGYTNETDTDIGRPGILLENAPAAGVDGTDGEHPRYNRIEGCSAREVGLYEKQASFYMQAKTAYTTITGNVFFNGPRAGINFNDGFCGGDELSHNLVFSTCRESGDHGPFNSWDRQPFFTLKDGESKPSMGMEWRHIHHNFFIDNYSPQVNVDNDDGSRYYHTDSNFFVYGGWGMKNDFGGHSNHHSSNIYAYIGFAMATSTQIEGKENHFVGNRVVQLKDYLGKFTCDGPGATVVQDNQYFTPTGEIDECGKPLKEWQKLGKDPNSTVAKIPKDEEIIGWAKALLGF